MHPDFKEAWDKKAQSELATPAITDALKEEIDAKWDAIRQAQARDGEAPKELVESGGWSVCAARQAQAFPADPFNKQNWKNLGRRKRTSRCWEGRKAAIWDCRSTNADHAAKLDNTQQTGWPSRCSRNRLSIT